MIQNNPQVPWTDEQWTRVTQVIQEEASRARVAATFLPLHGPLPPDTDFVRANVIDDQPSGGMPPKRLAIDDTNIIKLATLQVKVFLRGAQMADPEMTSALALFRRAANVLARLEDAIVFLGQPKANEGPREAIKGLPEIWEVLGGQKSGGLLAPADGSKEANPSTEVGSDPDRGGALVRSVSESIGGLESHGHFGPFAVVLDNAFFTDATTPNDSLVLPQDRIIPFLGGGSLLRSSTLPKNSGVVVALGGAPVELVVATDVSLAFLQVTSDPQFVFRVYEKIALRITQPRAVVALTRKQSGK